MNNSGNNVTDRRNYGIDLLRIVAMLGVVINHLIMQGGITVTNR